MSIAITQVIRIIKPGILCVLQDIGRFGYRHLGVPCSGASDRQSMIYANSILGNKSDSPVLEIYGQGAKLEILTSCNIFLAGANVAILLNDLDYHFLGPLLCHPGDKLEIKKVAEGTVMYLAISGGFYAPPLMDSVSYLPGTHLSALKKSDILYSQLNIEHRRPAFASLKPLKISKSKPIIVLKGPEFDTLSETSKEEIFKTSFTISTHQNRMGYRLKGRPMGKNDTVEVLTASVFPGVVQCLPDGQLIILMRDCQTTGGYPRILLVEESDINQLAQRSAGESVIFKLAEGKPGL